ncbi:hypothetical protein B0T16DRAFT_420519 [Cercophora newfieldiana]|uniref:Uncharacterized protein n=1 Tax=Cercophora newfieldiana TaxID=92897 RepID=A0AA39XWY0_9PEZI|nr:hypothetical protein B0T16DRAFT_420519 [Cercophora newfieldiana]
MSTHKQAQCHYPNGSAAPGDFPCDPDAKDSACCGGTLGSSCYTNKLCWGPDGNVARGSCTSQNWLSPECAAFCMSANAGGHDLIPCANITKTDTSYCCDGNSNCMWVPPFFEVG